MDRSSYKRYHIETKFTPNIIQHPYRFKVKVSKVGLAKFLLTELIHYKGNLEVVKNRPCMYGVFSGPVGGFSPREHLCVGCMRCTTQYPDMVRVLRNPERQKIGDDYFNPDLVDNIVYEAEHGRIPIKGMGYRGTFGGEGWNGMWTDMSEIVRPTRDGIHGREYISTEIDIGEKLSYLTFNEKQQPIGTFPQTVNLPLPLLFDTLPTSILTHDLCHILSQAAHSLHTFAVLPFDLIMKFSIKGSHIIPLVFEKDLEALKFWGHQHQPLMLELAEWNEKFFLQLKTTYPHSIIILRTPFDSDLLSFYHAGVRVFHLTSNYHGRGNKGRFVLDLIRDAHQSFVKADCRNKVSLIGSGGIVAAEHLPKAIMCGLDTVALDTPVCVALQARFAGPCITREDSQFEIPSSITIEWGKQRLKNQAGTWRDQLLEVMGAMGLREVRRLRGEMGRAMFQKDLEKEAFEGIAGYGSR